MDDQPTSACLDADDAHIVHRSRASTAPLPDAVAAAATRTSTCAAGAGGGVRARGEGPGLPRDRAVLVRLARHRLLSLKQLNRLTFAGLHRSRVSRRVSALVRTGWVRTWDDPRGVGGHVRFVAPTVAGLRWALHRIEEATRSSSYARLISTMLRRDGRRPLPLVRAEVPAWLTHLTEVNDVLTVMQGTSGEIVWASSWNRPLPNASHGMTLPQPDGVVVRRAGDGAVEVIFMEHDRGGESVRHFRSRKVDCYRQLAQRPGLLLDLVGVRAFHVLVTVNAGGPDLTARRIEELRTCATTGLAGGLFTIVPADSIRALGGPPANPADQSRQM
ncbi:MAG: replication-relaxation family protein [Thermoanaerobaculaceae bacterium]